MTNWNPGVHAGTGPAWRAIVRALQRDMEAGVLRPGDRLPPQRRLAAALGVALGTVTRAYREAESLGLVQGEAGRGTFVRASDPGYAADFSATTQVDLSLTWPLHVHDPDLRPSLERLTARDSRHLLEYAPHSGSDRHRAAGAAWAGRWQLHATADQVHVCAGVQHALLVSLLALAKAGDAVLADTVTYPGFKAAVRALQLRPHGVAADAEGMRADALAAAFRRTGARVLYLVPTLHNPTAAVLGDARRREIAGVVADFDAVVIEDDVHRLLHPAPASAFGTIVPDRTLSIVSLSKVVAGGLRVAYLVAPAVIGARLTSMIWATTWMTPPLNAEIAADWIAHGSADDTVRRKRTEADARQRLAADILRGADISPARHGYHLWLRLPRGWTSRHFCAQLGSRGVAVSAAESFALDEAMAPRAVRISLSAEAGRDRLVEGLERVRDLLANRGPAGGAVM